jgi:purine-nucleoside phosphorylase
MESSVLYYLAARARAAGAEVAAATILTVSDVLSEDVTSEESYLPLDELNRSIERMIEVALEAGTAD